MGHLPGNTANPSRFAPGARRDGGDGGGEAGCAAMRHPVRNRVYFRGARLRAASVPRTTFSTSFLYFSLRDFARVFVRASL